VVQAGPNLADGLLHVDGETVSFPRR